MSKISYRFLLVVIFAVILGGVALRMMLTTAKGEIELSQHPLPLPGILRANLVRLFGVRLGDSKRAVLNAGQARNLLIDDETDSAVDVVYFYRDRLAALTEVNLAAYRIRGGMVDAISLFGRLPRTTETVPRFEAVAPDSLKALLQACKDPVVRERILGAAEHATTGGTPPERTETYRYDCGRMELENTLYHFQHPRPSTSENCRLTFQRQGS